MIIDERNTVSVTRNNYKWGKFILVVTVMDETNSISINRNNYIVQYAFILQYPVGGVC